VEILRKFTLTDNFGNVVALYYLNGRLATIEGLENHDQAGTMAILINIPLKAGDNLHFARDWNQAYNLNYCLAEIEVTPTDQKIAMWCQAWLYYMKKKYKVSKADAGVIGKVEVSRELLQDYFKVDRWWNKESRSIGNYAKYINQIAASAAGTAHPAGTHKAPNTGAESFNDMAERLVKNRYNGSGPAHDNVG
jgi:hypothetical protein